MAQDQLQVLRIAKKKHTRLELLSRIPTYEMIEREYK